MTQRALSLDIASWSDGEQRQSRPDQMPLLLGGERLPVRLSVEIDEKAPSDSPQLRIQNLGEPVHLLWHDRELEFGEEIYLSLPVHIAHNDTHYEIRQHDQLTAFNRPFHTIENTRNSQGDNLVPLGRLGIAPLAETLSRWFGALERLQQNAAGTSEFFEQAARATTSPGGMTAGFILLREDNGWEVVGSHVPDPALGISYCCEVLERIVETGRTHYHDALEDEASLPKGADSVVAAPIFDDQDQVVGAVYGYRSMRSRNQRRSIRSLEAVWIQLLAGSVSAAMSRMAAETRAARRTILLEQAFSPKVIREITNNPRSLNGQEREVSILFADLRESTAMSETMAPQLYYEFLHELLDNLSQEVQSHEGVIIDYYGDGMAAMWNAPCDQTDHALLACRAALSMRRSVAHMNRQWQERVGRSIRLGIGIHTGVACVGNAGSRRRLKYGPRGTSVVVASRLEAATKRLGPSILVSAATAKQLNQKACLRRVCRAQLPGIQSPVDVYELCALDVNELSTDVLARIHQYEIALELFERGDLEKAEALMEQLANSSEKTALPVEFMLAAIRAARQPADPQRVAGIVSLS